MTGRLLGVIVAAVLGIGAIAVGAPSQTQIAQQLRCVTCGTQLDVSDAPAAVRMKERIAREIAAGRTEDQIIDGFVRDYGRQVLSTPPKSGIDLWLAWAIPIGLPLIALCVLPFIVRGWRRRRDADEGADLPLDDADRALVDHELARVSDES